MVTVKCYYENGDTITTDINGSLDDARNYFEGRIFNIGHIEDNLQKCVRVEEVQS